MHLKEDFNLVAKYTGIGAGFGFFAARVMDHNAKCHSGFIYYCPLPSDLLTIPLGAFAGFSIGIARAVCSEIIDSCKNRSDLSASDDNAYIRPKLG